MANRTGTVDVDVLQGTLLDDALTGLDGHDMLFGHAGNDLLLGGDGDDRLEGGLGDDVLNGGRGRDTVVYRSASGGVVVDLALGMATGAAGNDTLISIESVSGSDWNDTLKGNSLGNVLGGKGGDDGIFGASGDDWLFGEDGHDRLEGGRGFDRLSGGAGNDILKGGLGDDVLQGGLGRDGFDGGDGRDLAVFSDTGRAVVADLAAGTALTGDGRERLVGIEDLRGGSFDDVLSGDAGRNELDGGGGNDRLVGRDGSDALYGREGVDQLDGGAGDDVLDGGPGADMLRGGADIDRFVMADADGSQDTILDFQLGAGGDILDLSALLTDYRPGVDDVADFVSLTPEDAGVVVGVDLDGAANGTNVTAVAQLAGVTQPGLTVEALLAQGNLDVA